MKICGDCGKEFDEDHELDDYCDFCAYGDFEDEDEDIVDGDDED